MGLGNVTHNPVASHYIWAPSLHRASHPNKLTGVLSEYNNGACIVTPSRVSSSGSVNCMIYVFPEKPMV